MNSLLFICISYFWLLFLFFILCEMSYVFFCADKMRLIVGYCQTERTMFEPCELTLRKLKMKKLHIHKPHTVSLFVYLFYKTSTCNCVICGQIENFHYIDFSINVTHISLWLCIEIGDKNKKKNAHALTYWGSERERFAIFALTNRLLNL